MPKRWLAVDDIATHLGVNSGTICKRIIRKSIPARKTGRCAILFPHGVLSGQEQAATPRKLSEAHAMECVLGLGPNLFYNSPMEACVVICRAAKPEARKGRILFIDAVSEVTYARAQSFLPEDHIERIVGAYKHFKDEPGPARVATLDEIRAKDGNLSIPLYVAPSPANGTAGNQSTREGHASFDATLPALPQSSTTLRQTVGAVLANR